MTWVGIARSNYFRVRDRDRFLEDLEVFEETVSVIEDKGVADRGFCLLSLAPLGWAEDGTLIPTVARHLADGHVAVFIEAGFDRRSRGAARAVAVNNRQETRTIDLADIYTLAKELGDHVSAAEF